MEAVWACSNATAIASPEQFMQLIDKGLFKALIECLKEDNHNTVTIAIEGVHNILRCGMEHFIESGLNKFAVLADELGILESLEIL